jgi:hypothetical protein
MEHHEDLAHQPGLILMLTTRTFSAHGKAKPFRRLQAISHSVHVGRRTLPTQAKQTSRIIIPLRDKEGRKLETRRA